MELYNIFIWNNKVDYYKIIIIIIITIVIIIININIIFLLIIIIITCCWFFTSSCYIVRCLTLSVILGYSALLQCLVGIIGSSHC